MAVRVAGLLLVVMLLHGLGPGVVRGEGMSGERQRADLLRCYELALRASESLGIREAEVRAAEARYWQAVGAILPQVSLRLNERLQNNAGGGASRTTGESFGGEGSRNAFDGRVTLTQTIFNGFRDFKRAAARREEAVAGRWLAERTKQLLYLDVSDVFYQVLSLQADAGVLVDLERALVERSTELERRVGLGRSRRGELLAAQSDLAAVRVTKEQVGGLLGAAEELMAFLTGVPRGRLEFFESQPFPAAEELGDYLGLVMGRADVMAGEALVGAAAQEVAAIRSERWPEVNFEGNAFFVQQPGSERVWNFFITFSLPLFDGGIREARVREGREREAISRLSLEGLRRTADREVRTAYVAFWSSAQQFRRLQEAVRLSRETYEAQRSDYELGRASNLDVLVALERWQRLRREEAAAEMRARASQVELHVAAGKYRR